MVFVPTRSWSAFVMGLNDTDVVRLYACRICFSNFLDETGSKPQYGHKTRRPELGDSWGSLDPLSKLIAGNHTSFDET